LAYISLTNGAHIPDMPEDIRDMSSGKGPDAAVTSFFFSQ